MLQHSGCESCEADDVQVSRTHSEEQSRDGSAALDVNHGQQTGEVSLPGSGEEQPTQIRDVVSVGGVCGH